MQQDGFDKVFGQQEQDGFEKVFGQDSFDLVFGEPKVEEPIVEKLNAFSYLSKPSGTRVTPEVKTSDIKTKPKKSFRDIDIYSSEKTGLGDALKEAFRESNIRASKMKKQNLLVKTHKKLGRHTELEEIKDPFIYLTEPFMKALEPTLAESREERVRKELIILSVVAPHIIGSMIDNPKQTAKGLADFFVGILNDYVKIVHPQTRQEGWDNFRTTPVFHTLPLLTIGRGSLKAMKPKDVKPMANKMANEIVSKVQKNPELLTELKEPTVKDVRGEVTDLRPMDITQTSKLRAKEAIKTAESERLKTIPDPALVEKGRKKTIPEPELVEKGRQKTIPEEAKPKPIPKEPQLSEESGFVTVPDLEKVEKAFSSAAAKIDVEAPFKKIGAPETGFRIKNRASEENVHEIKATDIAKKFSKKYTKEERADLVLEVEKQTPTKLHEGYKEVRKYFDDYQKEYAKFGVNVDFKQNTIALFRKRIQDNLTKIEELKKTSPKEVPFYQKEIKSYQTAIRKLEKTEFEHIPLALWFDHLNTRNPLKTTKSIKLLEKFPRKTLMIQDLINAKVLKKSEIDIIDVLMSYGRRAGRDLSLLKVLESAKKEGLSKSAWKRVRGEWFMENGKYKLNKMTDKFTNIIDPKLVQKYKSEGLVELPEWTAGITRGWFHKEPFARYLDGYTNAMYQRSRWRNFMGTVKMMQFYNPFFLPMYDVVQHAMLQGAGVVKAPKYVTQAIKSKLTHDKHFYEAMENGLASKPFANPMDNFQRMVKRLKGTAGERALEHLKLYNLPARVKDVYNLSWSTAWHLDETVRLMSYHALKNKGFTSREAAQIGAKFHADYASVPPKLRNTLNKVFFTPTFKIAMGKLYYDMLKGAIKPTSKTGRTYAKGLLYTFGIIQGFDMYMTSQGWERDQWGRRYTRKIQTEEGVKEAVVVWSTPANMPFKYYFRGKQALEPGSKEPTLKRFVEGNSWEFHPVYRTAYQFLDPEKHNIYSSNDPKHIIAAKSALHVFREWFRIANAMKWEDPNSKTAKDRKILDKEMGKLAHGVTSLFAFTYTRGTPEQQKVWKVLNEIDGLSKEDKKKEENLEVFIKKLEKIIKK